MCSVKDCCKMAERRGMCQMHFWRLTHYGDVNYVRLKVVCSIDGCGKKNRKNGMCRLHSDRLKNGVPLDFQKKPLAKKRYRLLNRPEHPLAMKNGRIYEHRMVLFDSMGPGRVPCYWCGTPLEWMVNLFVDHKDHNRHNNVPTNLLPVCNSCNAGRTFNSSAIRNSIYTRG